MGVTVRDIAKAAGVSPATVSRALARPETVSDSTRSRVLQVARDLGYLRAQPPQSVSGKMVGIVVPDLLNPTFASFLRAAQHRLSLRGIRVCIVDTDRQAETEADAAKDLAASVDGMVICSPLSDPDKLRQLASSVPTLLVDGEVEGVPSLTIEYSDGMRMAVAHLVALGHQRIAYAGGRLPTWTETQRRRGLEQAIAGHGLPDFVDLGHFFSGVSGGYAAADQLLNVDATAIICINTLVAVGLINRLNQRGVRVPQDVSVLEFDAATTNQLVSPMLTTVAPQAGAVGQAAADHITRSMLGESVPQSRSIQVELLIQESTARPRQG